MNNNEIINVLVKELSKVSDQIWTYSIILFIALIILGLLIRAAKRALRKIFKK